MGDGSGLTGGILGNLGFLGGLTGAASANGWAQQQHLYSQQEMQMRAAAMMQNTTATIHALQGLANSQPWFTEASPREPLDPTADSTFDAWLECNDLRTIEEFAAGESPS